MTEAQRREMAYCGCGMGVTEHRWRLDNRIHTEFYDDCVQCASRLALVERVLAHQDRRWSMTWGEVPEDAQKALGLQPHEWDNKNISEQRDYAIQRLAASAQPTNANWREAVGNLIDTLIGGQDSCQDCGEDDEPCPACAVSTMAIQSLEAILRGEPTERVLAEGEKELAEIAVLLVGLGINGGGLVRDGVRELGAQFQKLQSAVLDRDARLTNQHREIEELKAKAAPLPAGTPTESPQQRAENLFEAIGGDLCICQRQDVPHWCESCQRRIQLIREALNAAAPQGWQLIESAPKDGTRFLGGWRHPAHGWVWGDGRWHHDKYDKRGGYFVVEGGEPTHWLPLPDPPKWDSLYEEGLEALTSAIEAACLSAVEREMEKLKEKIDSGWRGWTEYADNIHACVIDEIDAALRRLRGAEPKEPQ